MREMREVDVELEECENLSTSRHSRLRQSLLSALAAAAAAEEAIVGMKRKFFHLNQPNIERMNE